MRAAATRRRSSWTQSPALLNYLVPSDVITVESHDAHPVPRLTRTQLKDWLEDYSLGETVERTSSGRPLP